MKASRVFSGNTLKAADLNGGEYTLIIDSVEEKKFENGPKLLIHFRDKEKALVANKTNSKRLVKAYGDETDDWIGKEITLYVEQVDYQGEEVDAIRVRTPIKKAPVSQDVDDEIPF